MKTIVCKVVNKRTDVILVYQYMKVSKFGDHDQISPNCRKRDDAKWKKRGASVLYIKEASNYSKEFRWDLDLIDIVNI